MKKIAILAASTLLIMSQSTFATQARVQALGNVTAIVMDDDTNIDLFPQTIEKYSLLRIHHAESAGTNSGGYAAIIGESGKKWGVYGGQNETTANNHNREFVSIYHSVNQNAAYKAGVTMSSYDSEPTSGNSVYAMGANVLYGMKSGNSESAIYVNYDKDPYGAAGCTSTALGGDPISPTAGVTTVNGNCGESGTTYRSFHDLVVGYASRSPKSIALFSHLYWDVSIHRVSANYETTAAADVDFKATALNANTWLFNKKTFHKKDSLYYGVGFGFETINGSGDQETTGNSNKQTQRTVMGPNVALGLEKSIKYGVLRFGINRQFNIYQTDQTKTTNGGATTVDSNLNSRGYGGNYAITTGWGLEYENLKIDVVLNPLFWSHGPQMIFDGTNALGTRADIVYTF